MVSLLVDVLLVLFAIWQKIPD